MEARYNHITKKDMFNSKYIIIPVLFLSIALPALATEVFTDNFLSYPAGDCLPDGTAFGPWTVVFAGFGCVKIETDGTNNWLHAVPKVPKGGNTHSSLIVGPSFSSASGTFAYDVNVETISQTRAGGRKAPRAWEVGWVVWNYTDNDHFYYFIPKTNGWELGKRDPAYTGGQRFLATGTSPVFPIGVPYSVHITQDGSNTITASVNGVLLTTFTDIERPYTSGKIGLYTEDAHVHFDDVVVTQP